MAIHKVTGKAVFINKPDISKPAETLKDNALKAVFTAIFDAPEFLQRSFIQGGQKALLDQMYVIPDDTSESEALDILLVVIDHYNDICGQWGSTHDPED